MIFSLNMAGQLLLFLAASVSLSSAASPLFLVHPNIIATGDTTVLVHCSAQDKGYAAPVISWMSKERVVQSWSFQEGHITRSYAVISDHVTMDLHCKAERNHSQKALAHSNPITVTKDNFGCGRAWSVSRAQLLILMCLIITCLIIATLALYVRFVNIQRREKRVASISVKLTPKQDSGVKTVDGSNLPAFIETWKEKASGYKKFTSDEEAA